MMDGWLDGLSVTVTIIRQGLRAPSHSLINNAFVHIIIH